MKASDWIAALAATGTWAAVVTALFGDRIRARWLRRALQVDLVTETGELFQGARFYHVRVHNITRAPVAHDVQVVLTSIETKGTYSQPRVQWQGALPLGWKHPELHPPTRTVGPDADADLICVTEGKPLVFVPMNRFVPANFPFEHQPPVKLWVDLQARAAEGDSDRLRLAIVWHDASTPPKVTVIDPR